MNKKVLLMAIALLAVAMFVAPVMAEPTKGLKVDATLKPGPMVFEGVPEKQWITEGGIEQIRGMQVDYFPITLTIGSDVYTKGYSTNIQDVVYNPETGVSNIRSDTVWTFAGIGGFAGNLEMKLWFVEGIPWPYYSIHTLMHGFGAFEGQTLMLSYEGPITFPREVWTGYCLKG